MARSDTEVARVVDCGVVSRAGLFRSGSNLKFDKNFGLNLDLRRTFCLRCTKI